MSNKNIQLVVLVRLQQDLTLRLRRRSPETRVVMLSGIQASKKLGKNSRSFKSAPATSEFVLPGWSVHCVK